MTRKECVDGMQRIIDEDQNKILVRVHVGYLIHAVNFLKDQPDIVRCKDCKHRPTYPEAYGAEIDGKWCYWCELHRAWKHDDYFCADGEHKKDR